MNTPDAASVESVLSPHITTTLLLSTVVILKPVKLLAFEVNVHKITSGEGSVMHARLKDSLKAIIGLE